MSTLGFAQNGTASKRVVKTVAASSIFALRRLFVAAAMVFAAVPVLAQQAPVASASETPELAEIIVTDSMIRRPNAETAEAITSVSIDP